MSSSTSSTCILIEVRNRKKGEMEVMGGERGQKIWGSQLIGKIEWMEGGGTRERGAKSRDYSR